MVYVPSSAVLRAERNAAVRQDTASCLTELRRLSPLEFGEFLFSLPDPRLPSLSKLLPRMASEQVQLSWTGASGAGLLAQTQAFIAHVVETYRVVTGRGLGGRRVLDFGCGYGRMLRLLAYYADPGDIFGCDPWERSIQLCREDGVLGQLAVSDYLPRTLPFEGPFDLVYAFSVFTHLSRRATHACLETLSRHMVQGGMLVITVRPVEYWAVDEGTSRRGLSESLTAEHLTQGFAFRPHNIPPIDGDITYGEASMSLDYLRDNFPAFTLLSAEPLKEDPLQLVVFLSHGLPTARPAPVRARGLWSGMKSIWPLGGRKN